MRKIAVLLLAASLFPCSCKRSKEAAPAKTRPAARRTVVIAHRGGSALAPENTLAAIRKAIEIGADYVEIDVRTTKDGHLILMHDGSVDRTTDGSGEVSQLDLKTIQLLDAGSCFSKECAGQAVPTFDEALATCKGRINIYLDNKSTAPPALVECIKRHGMQGQVVVYGNVDVLREIRSLEPAIAVMPGLPDDCMTPDGVARFVREHGVLFLEGSVSEWRKELVDRAHELGCKVFLDCLGLYDNPVAYRQAVEMGVDGIQTDHPDVALKELERLRTSRPKLEERT